MGSSSCLGLEHIPNFEDTRPEIEFPGLGLPGHAPEISARALDPVLARGDHRDGRGGAPPAHGPAALPPGIVGDPQASSQLIGGLDDIPPIGILDRQALGEGRGDVQQKPWGDPIVDQGGLDFVSPAALRVPRRLRGRSRATSFVLSSTMA